MSQTPGIGSSREERSPSKFTFEAGSSASPLGAVVQETVLNPEGRRLAGSANDSSSPGVGSTATAASPDSVVWKRLFPATSEAERIDEVETPAGCELGHFSVEERIGSGGMGAVFRALDNRLQRVVALKVLSPAQSRDRAAVLRFENEARAAARLDHENIARVYYVGEDRGLHFIAFEYVTGQNVRDLIARTGRLSVADALNYTLQIASALRHTAAAGVIHRDIKPSNIIIAPNGRAKLVDLGLARKLAADSYADLTVAGTTLGTFDYISPEQARDPRNVDVRSDIYSLGCTLYHMLTGGPPYSSGTVLQKLLDHQSGQAPDPRTVNPQVPPALSNICRKMMAGDPRNRYATPDDLIRDLGTLAANLGLRPFPPDGFVWGRPAAQSAPPLRSGLIWAGIAAVVVLLAFLVDRWPARFESTPEPEVVAQDDQSDNLNDVRVSRDLQDVRDDQIESLPPPPLQGEPPPVEATAGLRANPPASSRIADRAVGSNNLRTGDAEALSVGGVAASNTRSQVESSRMTAAGETTSPRVPLAENDPEAAAEGKALFEGLRHTAGELAELIFPGMNPAVEASRVAPPAEEIDPPHYDVLPIALAPEKPIVRLSEVDEPQEYQTLADAVVAAYPGDTIVLYYDGRFSDSETTEPIEIDGKAITIQAGVAPDGRPYRPLLEFEADPSTASSAQMIALSGGRSGLTLQGVDLRVTVAGEARNAAKQWSVFSLAETERVLLRDVGITLVNPEAWPLAVFDLRPPEGISAEEYAMMGMMNGSRDDGFFVALERSFVRGGADLVTIAHTLPGRIELRESAIALRSALLNVTGGLEQPPSGDVVEVDFENVTAVVGDALLRLDLGPLPRYAAPVEVTARESVFSTSTAGPLVLMTGNADPAAFEQLLGWDGRSNIFDGFSEMWSILTEEGASELAPATFQSWKRRWTMSDAPLDAAYAEHFIDPNGDDFLSLWPAPTRLRTKNSAEFSRDDLEFDPIGAVRDWLVAPDGAQIGAPVDQLPELTSQPATTGVAERLDSPP